MEKEEKERKKLFALSSGNKTDCKFNIAWKIRKIRYSPDYFSDKISEKRFHPSKRKNDIWSRVKNDVTVSIP